MLNHVHNDDQARWAATFTAESGFFSAARLQCLSLWSLQVCSEEMGIRWRGTKHIHRLIFSPQWT
jgi:hypothetical protein